MTQEAMFSNSERNLQNVEMQQVKEIITQLDPSASNSIIIDEAVGLKRVNYCYVDVVSKHVAYQVERRQFHPREELAGKLSQIFADQGESPYVALPDRSMLALIGQSPKVSISNAIRNVFSSISQRHEVDASYIRLNADGIHLSAEQPLYLVKELSSMEFCPKCGGAKVVHRTNKSGELEEATCTECQGTGRIASVGIVNIDVKEHSDKYVLTNDDPIDHLKDSAIVAHVLQHSMVRYRTLTKFNQQETQSYDETLQAYVDQMHRLMGGEPATEDVYYQIIPCVEFTYRDVLSSQLCKGCILDVIDNPELILNLTSGVTKMTSAVKDVQKSMGGFFGKLGRTDKSKAKSDLKRATRLLIAITIADGKVETLEKSILLNQLRDMNEFTTSEMEDFSALLGKEDVSFLTDDDFRFNNPDKARETLVRMRQIAEADGDISAQEQDLIDRFSNTFES